jgi:hypothetical protein
MGNLKSRSRERRLDVYVIRNTETGGVYIGVSRSAKYRFKQHLGEAKNGQTGCPRILADVRRGVEFEMTVIARLGFYDALLREKREIANARLLGIFVYNQTDGGDYPMTRAEAKLFRQRESMGGRIPTGKSIETKRRIAIWRKAKKERPKIESPEVSPVPIRQRAFHSEPDE